MLKMGKHSLGPPKQCGTAVLGGAAAAWQVRKRNLPAASKVDGGRPIAVPSGSIRNGILR